MPIRPENRSLYPPDWREISARIRFVRAKYLCECRGECGNDHHGEDFDEVKRGALQLDNAEPEEGRCTALHGKQHPITTSRVILTVAHLNHDPTDCADENLLAMCQRCHLKYDAIHHAETRRRTRDAKLGLIPLHEEL